MKIEQAQRQQAGEIARLIMTAMNEECCQYFAGPAHTLADFEVMMTTLCARDDSQYSYLNTLVAIDEEHGKVAGVCVSYDGALLHTLRKAFLEEVWNYCEMDHSGMDDETQAGELYIDSLCVDKAYRGQGIATRLLEATVEKARRMQIKEVGLLVDHGNPQAEKLYRRVGFTYQNDATWGGHPMRHLVKHVL